MLTLSHGVKEGLVDQVKRWPGVHFAKSILGGKPLKGLWFNRTEEFAGRNRGEDFGRLKYAEEEELVLSQLPCWGRPGGEGDRAAGSRGDPAAGSETTTHSYSAAYAKN